MRGSQQHLLHRPGLHDLPLEHHGDAVREVRHDPHVVRDQQHPRAGVGGQPPQQIQDLGLNGDVERGGRLVRDEQARRVRDRHGDDHALPLPAGELEGERGRPRLRVRDADATQQFDRLPGRVLGGDGAVVAYDFGYLRADPGQRIECGRRFLEHHRRRTAAQAGEVGLGGGDDVGAADQGTPRGACAARQQPHRGERDRRLPGAGLADESQRFTGPDVERHVTDGGHVARLCREGDTQVLDPQDVGGHPRPLTSKASRSPSPIALNAHTTRMMARPGGTMSHQRPEYAAVRPADSIPPQSVDGGCTPRPR